jgi:hypothetical protein
MHVAMDHHKPDDHRSAIRLLAADVRTYSACVWQKEMELGSAVRVT